MTQTPEIPLAKPEVQKPAEPLGEIPKEVEQGQSLIQQQTQTITRPSVSVSSANQTPVSAPSVTVPADPGQLTQLSKGNPVNAITWFAHFWLRVIKKALALGSNIMTSQSVNIPVASPAASNVAASGNTVPVNPTTSVSDNYSVAPPVANTTPVVGLVEPALEKVTAEPRTNENNNPDPSENSKS